MRVHAQRAEEEHDDEPRPVLPRRAVERHGVALPVREEFEDLEEGAAGVVEKEVVEERQAWAGGGGRGW